jgi:epoxyqueuosine reductase
MNLQEYFNGKSIFQYSVASVDSFDATGRIEIDAYFPGCKSAIVFGKEIPKQYYTLNAKIQSYYLTQVRKQLDDIACDLSEKLTAKGNVSVPVIAFAPIQISQGKLRAVISIKHLAAYCGFGSMGMNTVIVSPASGNRTLLSGVLCSESLPIFNAAQKKSCTGCRQCIIACPGKAISENGVDMSKCLNLTSMTPFFIRPFFKPLLKLKKFKKYIELATNAIAPSGEMVCSKCITCCPSFNA